MNRCSSKDLRDLAQEYQALKESPEALGADTVHALLCMKPAALVHLAFKALEVAEAVDTKFGYTLAMLEQHIECSDDCQLGWVISQSQSDGGFNKFCKTMGGTPPTSRGLAGDVLAYYEWKIAKQVLDSYEPEIRQNFRIYPVVLVAGHEPRTTSPREELL